MQSSSKRVLLNTGILYGRSILTVGISLYTTRLILNALGSTDFGIFNLIAGVIAMLAFLNNAMATSTQRFLSFYQGKKDLGMQKKVFTNSLFLHLIIGIIIVFVLEVVGLFLFDGFLNIPLERVSAAKTVFHWMVVSVLFTILTVPFTGSLIAHENMLWVAIAGLLEVLLKFGLALYLYIIDFDKLIIYGIGVAVINALNLLFFAVYCFRTYDECTLSGVMDPDKKITKELTSFTGWNLFGALCGVGRTQGIAIILNLFFGTVVNAAYGIANQVASQMNFFSSTLLRAINPQIMKSEGAGERKKMLDLSMTASKFGFFLLAIVAIPCIFEMDAVLKLWLTDVPENTKIFCQLMLIGILTNQLTIGLQSAIQATGKIKYYQIFVGSIILLNLPISYILLYFGFASYSVIVAFIAIEFVACMFRIYFLQKIADMSVNEYFNKVFYKEILPLVIIVFTSKCITLLEPSVTRVLTNFTISAIMFVLGVYLFGIQVNEKRAIGRFWNKVLEKSGFHKRLTN